VGAGAWGLPAAAEAARRGHRVTLFDRYGPATALGSSGGPSRIWRLAHPDRPRVRMAEQALAAWRRLEELSGETILLRSGLLWRDSEGPTGVAEALAAEGVEYRWVESGGTGRVFPGLRDSGTPALFQPDAGTVLADVALRAQLDSLRRAGGRLVKARVREVAAAGGSPAVRLAYEPGEDDEAPGSESFDAVILAPGPWASDLLGQVGIDIKLSAHLQQVTYFAARPGWEQLPCIFDVGDETRPGMYGMPTPGRGYKIGLDRALRPFSDGDTDRRADPVVTAEIVRRVDESFDWDAVPTDSQVCCWTTSPDGRFVIDRVAGGRVVVACGDSGEGFKFSALMGELLADLAEGADPPDYAGGFGLGRFATHDGGQPPPPLGR
ncbi:MAG: FAD-dependent oxidoreductase, partial [Acidobacteriota bacterium]|nr:FAD-dependent oxidoreductase [Acidobacteriota bacterium]